MTPRVPRGADEVFELAAAQYHGLVAELAAEFDLDAGLEVALQSQHYTALVEGLAAELDLDAGVEAALNTLGAPTGQADIYDELPVLGATEPDEQEPELTDGEPYAQALPAVNQILNDLREARNDVARFRPSPVRVSRAVVKALDELSNGLATRSISRDEAVQKVQDAARRWMSGAPFRAGFNSRSYVRAHNIALRLQALTHRVVALFDDSGKPAHDTSWR